MTSKVRSDDNGSLVFHKGTEDDLANYVVNNAKQNDSNSVIEKADEFCWNNHWMMHVGDKKGKILDEIILKHKPTIILELGTYCGYSAVRMARFLPQDGKVITIDPNPLDATQKIITHSGLANKIFCFVGNAESILSQLEYLKNKIDMVFIDHDKPAYLNDLKLIENSDLLHNDSVIVADNVIIFKINDYLNHVRTSGLYSSSENILSTLEYDDSNTEEKVDGIEVSIWKGK